MKPHKPRHLRLVDDTAAGDGDPEVDTGDVEILLSDNSGFDWTGVDGTAGALHDRLKRLAAEVVVDEGVSTGMLHLYLVDPGFMGYLNKMFMGYDGPTDVLSFPIDGPEMAGGGGADLSLVPNTGGDPADIVDGPPVDGAFDSIGPVHDAPAGDLVATDDEDVDWDDDDDDSVPIHLGDVMVCPQVAAGQAPDHAGSLAAELSLLVIHGVLHVLGHDHAQPAEMARMHSRERHHLARLGYRHPVDR